jgi:hypothetical protein
MRQSCTSCLVQRRRESHYHGMEIARRLLRGGRREQEEQKANSAACCGCPHHRGLSAAYAGSSAVQQHGRRGKATSTARRTYGTYGRPAVRTPQPAGPKHEAAASCYGAQPPPKSTIVRMWILHNRVTLGPYITDTRARTRYWSSTNHRNPRNHLMTHLADITYVGYEYTLLVLPWM